MFKAMKLESDEVVIAVIRKHPFYMILHALGLILLALFPSLLLNVWEWLVSFLPIGSDLIELGQIESVALPAFFYNLWLLILWFVFIARFTDYYLDKWVLTNNRVIDVEQRGFFSREISSVRYQKIQDVTSTVSGLIPTVLNFGTLTIQTAGVEQEFKLPLTPNPVAKKELINDLKEGSVPVEV